MGESQTNSYVYATLIFKGKNKAKLLERFTGIVDKYFHLKEIENLKSEKYFKISEAYKCTFRFISDDLTSDFLNVIRFLSDSTEEYSVKTSFQYGFRFSVIAVEEHITLPSLTWVLFESE